MNRRSLLKFLPAIPLSACSQDRVIPEWPFRVIRLNPMQKIMWDDYHNFPFNIFIRNKGTETVMASKISDIYIGELRQITRSGIKFSARDGEILIDELDFNNHPINAPLWQGLFDEEFPDKFSKITIFTEMDFPNHSFLNQLAESGKFSVKIFSLKEMPKIEGPQISA